MPNTSQGSKFLRVCGLVEVQNAELKLNSYELTRDSCDTLQ